MRIGIVGGLCRAAAELSRVARKAGHEIEFHDGLMKSASAGALESMIGRSDVVVVVTEVNSHAAVQKTKDILRRNGRDAVYVRKASKSQLEQLFDQLTSSPLGRLAPA